MAVVGAARIRRSIAADTVCISNGGGGGDIIDINDIDEENILIDDNAGILIAANSAKQHIIINIDNAVISEWNK